MARLFIVNSKNLVKSLLRRLEEQIISLHEEATLSFGDPANMDLWDSEHFEMYEEIRVLMERLGLDDDLPFKSGAHMLEVAEMVRDGKVK